MRNFLAFLVVAILVLAGIGYYMEWYSFKTTMAPDGHKTYSVDVDTKKVQGDVNTGEKKVTDLFHEKPR